MASPALRRLAMEAKKPRHCEGVRVLGPCSESTPLKYSVEIVGPATYLPSATAAAVPCPYAGRVFELVVEVNEGYPFAPHTSVTVKPDPAGRVPLWHPSVNLTTGEVCHGLWDKPAWVEGWWLSQFAEHLRSHLSQPQAGGLNAEASAQLTQAEGVAAFEAKAREVCSGLRVEGGGGGGGGGGSSSSSSSSSGQ